MNRLVSMLNSKALDKVSHISALLHPIIRLQKRLLTWLKPAEGGNLDLGLLDDLKQLVFETGSVLYVYNTFILKPFIPLIYSVGILGIIVEPHYSDVGIMILVVLLGLVTHHSENSQQGKVIGFLLTIFPIVVFFLPYSVFITDFVGIMSLIVIGTMSVIITAVTIYYILRISLLVYKSLENIGEIPSAPKQKIRYSYENSNFEEIGGVYKANLMFFIRITVAFVGISLWGLVWWILQLLNLVTVVRSFFVSSIDSLPSAGFISVFGGILGKSLGGLLWQIKPENVFIFITLLPLIVLGFVLIGNIRRFLERIKVQSLRGNQLDYKSEIRGILLLSRLCLWHLLVGDLSDGGSFLGNQLLTAIASTTVAGFTAAFVLIVATGTI